MVSAVFWVPSAENHREQKVERKNHLNATLQAREDILHSVHCLSSLNPFIRRDHFFFIKYFGPYPGCQQTNLQHWISTVLHKYNELPNGMKGSLLLCPSSLACSSGCSSFCLHRLQDLQKQKGTSHATNTAKLGNIEPNY